LFTTDVNVKLTHNAQKKAGYDLLSLKCQFCHVLGTDSFYTSFSISLYFLSVKK